ncbi:MAG: hypothetical protein DRI84_10605 [Bacteroidetes bacterium]|nr:MAG: hypothetical protein DRI84_10605 [Bacteroidota bacterium]
MPKNLIVFEETGEICLKFNQAPEYLTYRTKIIKKSSGKNPVCIELTFIGIWPYAAPMPPEKHRINAENISSLFPKVAKWAYKYGYTLC